MTHKNKIYIVNILAKLLKELRPNETNAFSSIDSIPFIEYYVSHEKESFDKQISQIKSNLNEYMILKSHAYFTAFPIKSFHNKSKLIYVSRNPKDSLVSFYYFLRNFPAEIALKCDINEFVDLYITGLVPHGNYWDHTLQWYTIYKNQKLYGLNILWVYYQDLKNDFDNELMKIIDFLELRKHNNNNNNNNSSNTSGDDFDIKKVLNKVKYLTSFNYMQSNADKENEQWFYKKKIMFRKGKINDWKNYLNEKQSKLIDRITYVRFYGADIKHWYKAKDNLTNQDNNVTSKL